MRMRTIMHDVPEFVAVERILDCCAGKPISQRAGARRLEKACTTPKFLSTHRYARAGLEHNPTVVTLLRNGDIPERRRAVIGWMMADSLKTRTVLEMEKSPTAAAELWERLAFIQPAACIGSARWVWNHGLQTQKERHQAEQPNLGYSKLCHKLLEWKEEYHWLTNSHSQTLQQKLKDLNQAFSNFFQNPGHFEPPTFKKKADGGSIRYPQGFHLDNAHGRVFLPKIGWIPYRKSRDVTGTPKNVTIGFRNGKFSVSIQTDQEVTIPVHPHQDAAVSIDLGIVNHTTLFDGQNGHHCPGPKALTRRQRKLARFQRQLSRKKKFSQNWKKQKVRIARAHHQIFNIRHDHLHKLSTTIAKNHGIVVIEDLQVANMSHSAKGTPEAPGKNVRAKAGLNRSIIDQGWSKFRTLLEYKVHRSGGRLIAVPAQHTSQRCPACQHVSKDNRRTQARFACVQCGFEANADVAAAMNILAAGLAVIACGGHPVAGPMNQEPPVSLAA